MQRPEAVHKMIRGDKLKGKDYEAIRAYFEYLEEEVSRLKKKDIVYWWGHSKC